MDMSYHKKSSVKEDGKKFCREKLKDSGSFFDRLYDGIKKILRPDRQKPALSALQTLDSSVYEMGTSTMPKFRFPLKEQVKKHFSIAEIPWSIHIE